MMLAYSLVTAFFFSVSFYKQIQRGKKNKTSFVAISDTAWKLTNKEKNK